MAGYARYVIAKIFILAQFAALVRLLWARSPYRWFMVALACWIAQAVSVTLGPQYRASPAEIDHWLRTVWMPCEAVSIVATIAACIEAINAARSYVRDSFLRMQLLVASVALPACLVGVGVWFVEPITGDALAAFRIIRAWAWCAMALSLGVSALLLAMEHAKVQTPPRVRWHLALLLAVMAAHAVAVWYVSGDDATRALVRDAYRITVIAACAGWVIMGKKGNLIEILPRH